MRRTLLLVAALIVAVLGCARGDVAKPGEYTITTKWPAWNASTFASANSIRITLYNPAERETPVAMSIVERPSTSVSETESVLKCSYTGKMEASVTGYADHEGKGKEVDQMTIMLPDAPGSGKIDLRRLP